LFRVARRAHLQQTGISAGECIRRKEKAVPIEVPPEFRCTPYDDARHPGAAEFDFDRGANCQLWAYALLKHFGIEVPPFRSSELWDDNEFGVAVHEMEPLDLVLFNDTDHSWGAHVGVYLGAGVVAHLSRHIGLPEVRTIEEMLRTPKYRVLVGTKRMKPPNRSV
jgi:hypothetical protein